MAGIFTQSRAVWLGELETRPKTSKINCWGLIFLFLSANFFSDVDDSAKKIVGLATSKKKFFHIASVYTSIASAVISFNSCW